MATVIELVEETPRTKSIVLDLPDRRAHSPGQHVDLGLATRDGCQAQRSYSIASAPEDDYVMLTIERLAGGEVSSYLVDELRHGDGLEVRGPVGGYFAWRDALEGPLLLVAGRHGHCASSFDAALPRGDEEHRAGAPALLGRVVRRAHLPGRVAAVRRPRRDGRQRHPDWKPTGRLVRVPGPSVP
jgi:Oxidoreductase FAD-binding domain